MKKLSREEMKSILGGTNPGGGGTPGCSIDCGDGTYAFPSCSGGAQPNCFTTYFTCGTDTARHTCAG